MKIVRPLYAFAWLAGGIGSLMLSFKVDEIIPTTNSNAGLFGAFLLCFVMFIEELRYKQKPKRSSKLNAYSSLFRALKKAGISFSRNAKSLVSDKLLNDHLESVETGDLILACLGDLYSQGKIRPRNFAAAPPGDIAAMNKAIKKLSNSAEKTIYSVKAYDGTILISIDRQDIGPLNSTLAKYDVEFTPYSLVN